MASNIYDYHLFHIQDLDGERTVSLHAATYSIGRDSANALVINDPTVSRHHCLLIRVPVTRDKYIYRFVDGDINGGRSTNGTLINSNLYPEKVLESRDFLQLGQDCSVNYMIAKMTQSEFDQYFSHTILPFHSVQEEILDPTGTLVTFETCVA